MHHEHEQMFVVREFEQRDPHQRTAREIERLGRERLRNGLRIGRVHASDTPVHRHRRMDGLRRQSVLRLAERRAQHFVARADRVERRARRIGVERPTDPQAAGDVIRTAVRLKIPQEPLPLLRMG